MSASEGAASRNSSVVPGSSTSPSVVDPPAGEVTTARSRTPERPSGIQQILGSGRTPAKPSPASHNLGVKDKEYSQKILQQVVPTMIQVSYEDFMSRYASGGQDLTEEELQGIGDFSDLDKVISTHGQEPNTYPVLSRIFNKVLSLKSKDGLQYKDTADWQESSDVDSRPDAGIYPSTDLAKAAFALVNPAAVRDTERRQYAARVAYAFAELLVEIKINADISAFYSGNGVVEPFLRRGPGNKSITQIAKYAAQMFDRQHRVFLFMIYITRMRARLICWDRSGAAVSENINLKENPGQLLNFISRFATMTPEQRGYDPTADFATKEQLDRLRAYHSRDKNEDTTGFVKDILDNARLYPIYQVRCPVIDTPPIDADSSQPPPSRQFLIGKYLSASHSLTGRATRGFIAFDIEKERLVFLKDYWRPDADGVHPELDVYARLKQNNVRYVATAIGGGDVGGSRAQLTSNQELIPEPKRPKARIHYRVLLEQVGQPLEKYDESYSMIIYVAYALIGHQEAWEKARILHRDVSVNNILIHVNSPDGELTGFLNDWDMCKYQEDMGKEKTQDGRSGTWPFQSALLLKYPLKPNELSDDLESFIHVVTWLAFRFHRHQYTHPVYLSPDAPPEVLRTANQTNKGLNKEKHNMFDEEWRDGEYFVGGEHKFTAIQLGRPTVKLALDAERRRTPLAALLDALYQLLQQHYRAVDMEALDVYLPRAAQPAILGNQRKDNKNHERKAALKGLWQAYGRTPGSTNPIVSSSKITYPDARRILDSHGPILDAFMSTLSLPGGQMDKTADQFLDLGQADTILTPGPSVGRTKRKTADSMAVNRNATGAPSGSHRKSQTPGDSASRKRKTVTDSTTGTPSGSHNTPQARKRKAAGSTVTGSTTGTPSSSHLESQTPDDSTSHKRRKADTE